MSKLLWIFAAGGGLLAAAAVVGSGDSDDEKTPSSGGDSPPDKPDYEKPTYKPDPKPSSEPKPGVGKPGEPSTNEPPPRGPPPAPPSMPLPYEEYRRGPYTIDLTGFGHGIRWRVYPTDANPTTEAAKDEATVGAKVELTDEDARVAADAFVDTLVRPPEPPMPPRPTPDGPDSAGGPDGAAGPDGAPSPPHADGGAAPATDEHGTDDAASSDAGADSTTTGHPLPPVPSPDPPAPPADDPPARAPLLTAHRPGFVASYPKKQRRGLNAYGCRRIEVDDIVSWIAWAEPWIRPWVATINRQKLVEGLLTATFPGCEWDIAKVTVGGGRRLVETLAEVDAAYFAPVRAGQPWPPRGPWEPHPLERAVAELVGASVPPVGSPEFAFRGHHVELFETAEGWVWRAWRRGKHGDGPDVSGGRYETMAAALSDIRARVPK